MTEFTAMKGKVADPPKRPTRFRIPERPAMPDAVVDWLESRLRGTRCFLEYGAGGSTRLAASLGVPRIVSVESDLAFAKAVRKLVVNSGSDSILDMLVANIGNTGDWGSPVDFSEFRRWPEYSLGVWDFMRKKKLMPELILIDGRFRMGCFLASLMDAVPGTVILFDDYGDRPEFYGQAEAYLKPVEVVDRSAVFEVPDLLPRPKIARALARYVSHPE